MNATPFKNQKLTNVMKNAKSTQTVNSGVWKYPVTDEMPNKQPKEWEIPVTDEMPNKQPKEWEIPVIDEVPNKQPKEWEVKSQNEMPELPTVKIPAPFKDTERDQKKPWKVSPQAEDDWNKFVQSVLEEQREQERMAAEREAHEEIEKEKWEETREQFIKEVEERRKEREKIYPDIYTTTPKKPWIVDDKEVEERHEEREKIYPDIYKITPKKPWIKDVNESRNQKNGDEQKLEEAIEFANKSTQNALNNVDWDEVAKMPTDLTNTATIAANEMRIIDSNRIADAHYNHLRADAYIAQVRAKEPNQTLQARNRDVHAQRPNRANAQSSRNRTQQREQRRGGR